MANSHRSGCALFWGHNAARPVMSCITPMGGRGYAAVSGGRSLGHQPPDRGRNLRRGMELRRRPRNGSRGYPAGSGGRTRLGSRIPAMAIENGWDVHCARCEPFGRPAGGRELPPDAVKPFDSEIVDLSTSRSMALQSRADSLWISSTTARLWRAMLQEITASPCCAVHTGAQNGFDGAISQACNFLKVA